jgi:hypothetical protein
MRDIVLSSTNGDVGEFARGGMRDGMVVMASDMSPPRGYLQDYLAS